MSDEEKALLLMRMVDECKAIRSDLVSLRAKAREIGIGLTHVGGTLSNAVPDIEVFNKYASAIVPSEEIIALVEEIRSNFERQTFLERELQIAGISVTDVGQFRSGLRSITEFNTEASD